MEERKLSEQEQIRRKKVEKLEKNGIFPFGKKLDNLNNIKEIINKYKNFSKEDLEKKKKKIVIAGRIMTKRSKGKAGFLHIQSEGYQIQIYVRKDNITDKEFDVFLDSDIGDIISIEGEIFKTNKGELSIRAYKYLHVTKSLRPFPEKYHGLKDIESRYRQRYLDLIMNNDVRKTFILRSKIISSIREYMEKQNFLEVETPILQSIPGGAKARPFKTYHNTLDMDLYMRIAPELYLKRLIIGGFDRVYEIGRNFRNEGIDPQHNPEFTMLEAYLSYSDVFDMMELCENLIKYIIEKNNIKKELIFNGQKIDLSLKFKKIHMVDFIKQYTGINFWEDISFLEAKEIAKKNNVVLDTSHNQVGYIINEIFEQICEKKIINPTFIYGHPTCISPLTNTSKDPRFSERFELFISGIEISNAYSELNNPIIQLEKFKEQLEQAKQGDEEISKNIDYDFLKALEYGMPPTGGIGIGIDRLVMLFTEEKSIRDILFFPHTRFKE